MSVRTVTVIGVIMSSTSVLARVDSAAQAAHEIIRQLWILLFQFVECINISNQAIVATALGARDYPYALAVVKRHIVYAISIVSAIAAICLALQTHIVGLFTADAVVIAAALTTIPLVTACFPLDAVSSLLDGTLTAAGQAKWTATNATVGSFATFLVLVWAEQVTAMSVLRVWMCLKLMTVFRLPLVIHRTFFSSASPFVGALRGDAATVRVKALGEDRGGGAVTATTTAA